MQSVEAGKSFLQEIFCGDSLLVVVPSTVNKIFVAYTHATIKVDFVWWCLDLFFFFF